MADREEQLALSVQIARVEQIQHALTTNDANAEDMAMEYIQEIADLPDGFMLIVTGIGAVLRNMERRNES